MKSSLRSKTDFKASRSPYETSNLDVKCARYAQVHNRINEEDERRQQTHYFYCDQTGKMCIRDRDSHGRLSPKQIKQALSQSYKYFKEQGAL